MKGVDLPACFASRCQVVAMSGWRANLHQSRLPLAHSPLSAVTLLATVAIRLANPIPISPKTLTTPASLDSSPSKDVYKQTIESGSLKSAKSPLNLLEQSHHYRPTCFLKKETPVFHTSNPHSKPCPVILRQRPHPTSLSCLTSDSVASQHSQPPSHPLFYLNSDSTATFHTIANFFVTFYLFQIIVGFLSEVAWSSFSALASIQSHSPTLRRGTHS